MLRAQAMFGLAGFVLAILVLSAKSESHQLASISCREVVKDIIGCADFLKLGSSETKPLQPCCDGIKKLSGEVGKKQDLVDICNCIKRELDKFGNFGYDLSRISGLPKACGLNVTFRPIDKNFNCSKVAYMG